MSNGDFRVIPSIFAAIIKDGKVLLLRRANTGWLDGWYDLPAGHLEPNETFEAGAVRELKEEAGLEARPEDLRLLSVYQNYHRPEIPHFGYIFVVGRWSGEPKIMEPDKCDDLGWFALDGLPAKTTPYVRQALVNIGKPTVSTLYFGPGSIPQD